jgi:hypothetical protein
VTSDVNGNTGTQTARESHKPLQIKESSYKRQSLIIYSSFKDTELDGHGIRVQLRSVLGPTKSDTFSSRKREGGWGVKLATHLI